MQDVYITDRWCRNLYARKSKADKADKADKAEMFVDTLCDQFELNFI